MSHIETVNMFHSTRNAIDNLGPVMFTKLRIAVDVLSQRAPTSIHLDRNTFNVRPHVTVDVRAIGERGMNEILNNIQVESEGSRIPILYKLNGKSLHILAETTHAGSIGPD